MNKLTFALLAQLLCFFSVNVTASDNQRNVVLVTLDGVRWQEVFDGIDKSLIDDSKYSHAPEQLREKFWHDNREQRRQKLFPFIWSTIVKNGVLLGDRRNNSTVDVSNKWWFSYPGYNEILTGKPDPKIDSNDKNWNENLTLLEALNNFDGFKKSVMAFGSWDVFPYIINSQRSNIPVNAGFAIEKTPTTAKLRWLNESSQDSPKLWSSVRLDYLTHGYALEALRLQHPRVMYIAYGETDDFAHDGSYDRYIDAAKRTDLMLSKLWDFIQSDPFYKNKTNLIITTDHGRGNTPEGWQHHLSPQAAIKMAIQESAPDGVPGSEQIWIAAIGPSVNTQGHVDGKWTQAQIAATVISSLGLEASHILPDAAPAISEILK